MSRLVELVRSIDSRLREISIGIAAVVLASSVITSEIRVQTVWSTLILLWLHTLAYVRTGEERSKAGLLEAAIGASRARALSIGLYRLLGIMMIVSVLAVVGFRFVEIAVMGTTLNLSFAELARAGIVLLVGIVLIGRLWRRIRIRRTARIAMIAVLITGLVIGPLAPTLELGGVSPVGTASAETYNVNDLSLISTDSTNGGVSGIDWNDDGTKLFISVQGSGEVIEYDVSDPWNVTSATQVRTADVGGEASGLTWAKNGTKLYIARQNGGSIVEYDASDAYNVSTLSSNGSVSVNNPTGIEWSGDGTKFFYPNSGGDQLEMRSVSTPFDISSGDGSVDDTLGTGFESNPRDIAFNNNGSRLYIAENENDRVRQWDLSDPYNMSSASGAGAHSVPDSIPSGLGWGDDGKTLYVTGRGNNNIYTYTTSDATISGVIKDSDGSGLSGALVTVNTSSESNLTASDGSYSLKLNNGTHEITASKDGYADNSITVTVSGSDLTGQDITLSEATNSISGTVVDQSGEAVSGATVELWMMVDSNTSTDAGETVEEAQEDTINTLTRAVPRERFNPDLDPISSSELVDADSDKHVLIHDRGAWLDEAEPVSGVKYTIAGTGDLSRPLIELEAGETYAFSIWDRSRNPLLEDGVDDKINPGVSTEGTVVVRKIGPGNSSVRELERETVDQVATGWPTTVKTHEYAEIALPTGYYEVVPKSGGVPIVIRVGSPEEIPRSFNKDLDDVDGELTQIATDTQAKLDSGAMKRVTVTTDSSGSWSYDVPAGYSTVAITAFDGQGLTEGITDPTLEDLRTQVVQQEYNGSIYLSTSPKIVHPPKSGITITVTEISRPTWSDLQAYLDHLAWVEELLNDEAFSRLSTLWTDPSAVLSDEELRDRAKALEELVEQNNELEEDLGETQEDLERLRDELESGTISREDLQAYLANLTKAVQESQPTIIVETEEPDLDVPEDDSEPTLLDLTLPVSSRIGEDSSLTKAGVEVLVHFDNGSSTTMPESYYSIDNAPGSSQGTGSEIVIDDYPIPADVAVASIEVLVANDEGTGRTQVPIENPAFEGTPPELASIEVSSMRPGPDERVSLSVTPTDSSTYKSLKDVTVYDPNGSTISTTVSGGEATFTTNGAGSHLIELVVSDGSHNYTETIRIKAGDEPLDYPASVRIHNGVLGGTVIASDGVESAELTTSRGGSIAQITAKVDSSDVPNEIHVHGREITGLQQDVTVSVVSSSDEARITQPVRVKLHLSRLSEDALVRVDDEPIPDDGNRFGRVDQQGDSTLVTAITRGGESRVEINNNPSIAAEIMFWIDLQLQRLPAP